ncbi:MAG: Rpn family recombination-promoting nuclease/putative transposase [Oscillospiraceae bacterium]|nr:Rpn family recombination-promoting nuclease/putative transposase [Oscillospiraceae bacterium]
MTELKVKPKIDVAFKKIFSENLDLLRSLISAALEMKVENVTLKPGEVTPSNADEKFCRLDVRAEADGKEIDIEIQRFDRDDYRARAEYYSSLMFARLPKGMKYNEIPQTILINILDYKAFESEDYHSTFLTMEANRHEILTGKKVTHFFELRKIPSLANAKKDIEFWLNLIKADFEEQIEELEENAPFQEIKKAVGEVKRINRDKKFIWQVEAREVQEREEMSALSAAHDAGRREGREEGIFSVARNLLAKNISIDIVRETTGLSIKEIESLQKI